MKKYYLLSLLLAISSMTWADGYEVSYTSGTTENVATITQSESGTRTWEEVLAEANAAFDGNVKKVRLIGDFSSVDLSGIKSITIDLSEATITSLNNNNVKYVVLPNGMTKEKVNSLAKGIGTNLESAASAEYMTEIQNQWVYGDDIIYTGDRTNENGNYAQGTIMVDVPLTLKSQSFIYNDTEYTGTVLIGDENKYYGVSDENYVVELSSHYGYTYTDNSTLKEYEGLVCTQEDKNYGVVNPTSIYSLILNQPVSYTYDNGKYAYTGRVYDNGYGAKYFFVGGTEVSLSTTSKGYTYTKDEVTYLYDGLVVEGQNGSFKGHVGGNEITLTSRDGYLMYGSIYTGPVATDDGEKYYGTQKNINEAKDLKAIPENSYYLSGNIGGVGYVKYLCDASEANATQYSGTGYYYEYGDKKIIYESKVFYAQNDEEHTNPIGFIADYNQPELTVTTVYYIGDEIYSGTVFPDDKGFDGGEDVDLTSITETLYYYTDEYGSKIKYTGMMSSDKYGCINYISETNLTILSETTTMNLYEDNGKLVIYKGKVYGENTAYIGGTEYELTAGTLYTNNDEIYVGKRSADNTKGYTGSDEFLLTTLYTYSYQDPNNEESTKEYQSNEVLTTISVEKTVELTYKEVYVTTGKVTLTAYVVKPGTLVYTLLNMSQLGSTYRDWAGSGNFWYIDNGYFKYEYSCDKVEKLILSGNLNAIDMNFGSTVIDKDTGHYSTSSENLVFYNALPGCKAPYLDLTDALFGKGEDYHPEDMTLTSNYGFDASKLETVLLPTDESQNTIPCNFLSLCNRVKELCIPYNYEIIEARAFFNAHGLTHIYTTDPRNEDADPDNDVKVDNGDGSFTFSANLKEIKSDGNESSSTFFGDAMQTRVWDIYVLAVKAPKCGAYAFQGDLTFGNNGFAGNWTHPIQRSNYINNEHVMCKLHYPSMSKKIGEEENYTDVTKVYTLADETGLVDGYGQPLMWPRHEEFYRTFRQAITGYIWGAWKEKDESGVVISEIGNDNVNLIDGTKTYNQDYQGWHEFVLTDNYNVQPFEPQKFYQEYDEKDWYTLCVPYDLTKSQLLQALGVKAGNKVKTLNGTGYEETSVDVYPDVRTLVKVKRSLNSSTVIFTLSDKLLDGDGNVYDLELNAQGTEYTKTTQTGDDPVVIKGGYPYLVKSYWPNDDQIKKIGNYVMSVAESNEYRFNEDCKYSNYMLPTKEFKMIAINDNDDIVYKDAEGKTPAYYYFVGTYVQNSIPKYSYYLGKSKNGSHNFFRAVGDGIAWNIYSAIITPLSTLEYNLNSDASKSDIANIKLAVKDNADDLVILEGESKANAGKPLTFLLDENNGTVTGIKEISSSSCYADGRIYTLGGQFVGASFKGLPKGVYVKDGKKYVVK